jgi:short-subunit dehydrogenase
MNTSQQQTPQSLEVNYGDGSQHQLKMTKLSVAVTGASRGIGLEIARSLKDISSNLSLVASSEESFKSVRGEFGKDTQFYGADFSSVDAVAELAATLRGQHPQLDVLVNNCGVYSKAPFATLELPDIKKILDVNVTAAVALTRLLLDQLKAGSNAMIINISSIQASAPSEEHAVYAASKAALTIFSQGLRAELNPLGIRVTVLEPSGVNTWEDPNPAGLLTPTEVGQLVRTIVLQNPHCQIDEIRLSAI